MGAIAAKEPRTLEIEKREVKFLDGQYRILDVPHIVLSRPAPNGERFARNVRVDMKLSKMYRQMKASGILVMRFEDFTN